MELVTKENLDEIVKKYAKARGGENNEDTNSEAAFVLVSKYLGAYILNTWAGPIWIGMQNATARWTNGGKPFDSARAAIEAVMDYRGPAKAAVYYSEDSVERLRYLANSIENFKKCGDVLLWVQS